MLQIKPLGPFLQTQLIALRRCLHGNKQHQQTDKLDGIQIRHPFKVGDFFRHLNREIV